MCPTCGCLQAHRVMGDNVTYEELKGIADGNGRSVAETLEIVHWTVAIDRAVHEPEYADSPPGSDS